MCSLAFCLFPEQLAETLQALGLAVAPAFFTPSFQENHHTARAPTTPTKHVGNERMDFRTRLSHWGGILTMPVFFCLQRSERPSQAWAWKWNMKFTPLFPTCLPPKNCHFSKCIIKTETATMSKKKSHSLIPRFQRVCNVGQSALGCNLCTNPPQLRKVPSSSHLCVHHLV